MFVQSVEAVFVGRVVRDCQLLTHGERWRPAMQTREQCLDVHLHITSVTEKACLLGVPGAGRPPRPAQI